MATVSVIIPGAGAGRRFGGRRSKIFEPLAGEPMFLRTLEVFTGRDDVCQVQLVVAPADVDELTSRFAARLRRMSVAVVEGGATRPESVRNALANVTDQAHLVCVHDAVRPCVSPLWVEAVFEQAERTGAAILAYPVHGTLKKVSEAGLIDQTVPRQPLWEAQTPQVFRLGLLQAAYAGPIADATDDAQLVEAVGHPVSVVPGDPRNIKITTRSDLALAAAVIDSLPGRGRRGPAGEGQD